MIIVRSLLASQCCMPMTALKAKATNGPRDRFRSNTRVTHFVHIIQTHVETNEETKGQRLSCHQRGAYCYRASYCPISVLLSNASCFCLFFLGFSSCPPSLPPFLPWGEDQTRGRGSYHHGLVVHVTIIFFPQASAKSNLVKVIYAYLLYCLLLPSP